MAVASTPQQSTRQRAGSIRNADFGTKPLSQALQGDT
jgi:hypothetical protein